MRIPETVLKAIRLRIAAKGNDHISWNEWQDHIESLTNEEFDIYRQIVSVL